MCEDPVSQALETIGLNVLELHICEGQTFMLKAVDAVAYSWKARVVEWLQRENP